MLPVVAPEYALTGPLSRIIVATVPIGVDDDLYIARQSHQIFLRRWNASPRSSSRRQDAENTELGFVALSQLMRDSKIAAGSWWPVPPEMHKSIRQGAVLLSGGKDSAASRAFLAFPGSDKAKATMHGFGYKHP